MIPLPTIEDQHLIVTELERRLSVVDALEATVVHGLARAERLRQSILKRGFEGRLVPQDFNDEPAGVLLERIRSERAKAVASVKRSGRGRRARQLMLGESAG